MREKGEQGLSTFSQAGEFQDGNLYVYVLGMDGKFIASGGSSAALIGRNVRELTDSDGRPFFREILDGARTIKSGTLEYRWYNPVRNRAEPKIATYHVVGDRILVVGYYAPNASIELAKSMLWRAVHELKVHGERAFERFNSLDGGFVQDDLYVFVVGLEDELVYAHGGSPRQVGRKAGELVDAKGKYFIREMIALAKSKGEGDVHYAWRNPANLKVENKHSYIVRVGKYLVGAGAYAGSVR
ncbi:cache domain-containing protein [Aromatoleum anaerobium]|uniref:Single Cache domain-containing protein n=2 Tax=Aromatoleum TaxID=551759 RepID=A0ABX1PQY3_9RHOO|nr:cache domain-containing protein [Aromatoleum anaerobium]MCK0508069.1 cache domain-containing protein [Aromatoleum anaerobium]